MARLRDTLSVLNGLSRVAVAFSVEVSRELCELTSIIPTALQSQFNLREERYEHGLPDDFPGWENFKTGEFGMGTEYSNPVPSPPPHPPADIRQPPPGTPSDMNHQRSLHTLSSSHLLCWRSHGKARAIRKHAVVSEVPVRCMSSGDTVVGSTTAGSESEKSHIEQQKKVSLNSQDSGTSDTITKINYGATFFFLSPVKEAGS